TCVLNHPDAGVLSAYGIGLADVIRHRAAGVYRPLSDELLAELRPQILTLADEARAAVRDDGVDDSQIATSTSFDLRYRGLDAFITIAESVLNSDDALPDASRGLAARLAEAYEAEHRRLYGYVQTNRPIEVVAVRAEAVGRSPDDLPRSGRSALRGSPEVEPRPEKTVTAWFDAQPHATRVYRRETLAAGTVIDGPAILAEDLSTTIVEPGWQAEAWSGGLIVLTRSRRDDRVGEASASRELDSAAESSNVAPDDSIADPILLEIFNNQFAGIAEQMGITLRATSSSVNVKERLDFSCAIFTADGDLVVNAPHIPVHLGAMSETVRAIRADNPRLAPGDVYVTNDPYRGGSHLPDVTVVTPVFDAAGRELRFFTASRAHHAEIGGIRPGSMPPFSRTLAEEGVLIRNFKLVDAGRSRAEELRELLSTAPYPSRSVDDNLADLAAQVAANHQGAVDLQRLIERHGWSRTSAYMRHIQAAAERKMRAALAKLPDGRREFRDHLDDGSPIVVAITLEGGRATIDFTGTGPVLAGNLNANRAIVTAAVMYVLRALIDEEIPLNQGVLAPIQLVLPECLLNPRPGDSPATSPAVVGGNVETSQRVVDVLLGAFGLAAASQGTMNNLLFGDGSFGYYETICGGAGGTPRAAGADAVHTHMTNTRLTDPEVMERRFP
ncbi:MAG TPA: hydantoinase B/oxoprolinase family protein, partial [Pirellulaceae bacterium]|nr:hydantoinase B/oxoprolinase family protein [Pirellulaceae bacterium]